MGGKSGQTVGYHYIMTMLGDLSRGPLDELVQIDCGDEMAWQGSVTDDTPTVINKPDLFGGKKREGGIQGAFRLLMGADDQVLPGDSGEITVGAKGPVKSTSIPDIKAMIGVPMGEMRGTAMLVFDGLVSSMSPYPKEWKFRLRRALQGWYGGVPWYPEKAVICMQADGAYEEDSASWLESLKTKGPLGMLGYIAGSAVAKLTPTVFEEIVARRAAAEKRQRTIKAMNPAHIVYQTLTDPLWGAGEPASALDENSFIHAANTFCAEVFGLCFLWARQEDVQSFLQVVMDHTAGALYKDPQTGLWTFRLIRDDYDFDDLPVYTFASGLLDITEENNASGEESLSELRVMGRDPVNNEPFEVMAQTLAAVQDPDAQVRSEPIEFKGIPTRGLALRVAERDLKPHAAGLKRYKLEFDRRAWTITPAMPIRIQAPERGLDDIVLRVGDVEYGTPDDPKITVTAVEDVFSMPQTAFGTVVSGSPVVEPDFAFPSPVTMLDEVSFRELYRTIGRSQINDIDSTTGFIGQYALAPLDTNIRFDLASKTDGDSEYRYTEDQTFVAWGNLAEAIGPTDTEITIDDNFGLASVEVGQALHLGDYGGEIVRVEAVAGSVLTIARGCVDTVPASHDAGASVWDYDDDHGLDGVEYLLGENVTTLVLTRTLSDVLEEDDATAETITIRNRHALPYPPGVVTVDGISIYALDNVHQEPSITWAYRDRTLQFDQLVAFSDAGDVGPEPGSTQRVRVYDPADLVTPLRTVDDAARPWVYDETSQGEDGNLPIVVVEIDTLRDGLGSWQAHRFTVHTQGGWGYAWGMDYGGS